MRTTATLKNYLTSFAGPLKPIEGEGKIDYKELPTLCSTVLLPSYVKCFTENLRAEGYYCTNNVKTNYQFEVPFTAWDECGDKAHCRNKPDKTQPFFAVFNPMKTHESGIWEEKTPEITFAPDKIEVPPIYPDTPEVRKALARMYTNIEYNDRILERF